MKKTNDITIVKEVNEGVLAFGLLRGESEWLEELEKDKIISRHEKSGFICVEDVNAKDVCVYDSNGEKILSCLSSFCDLGFNCKGAAVIGRKGEDYKEVIDLSTNERIIDKKYKSFDVWGGNEEFGVILAYNESTWTDLYVMTNQGVSFEGSYYCVQGVQKNANYEKVYFVYKNENDKCVLVYIDKEDVYESKDEYDYVLKGIEAVDNISYIVQKGDCVIGLDEKLEYIYSKGNINLDIKFNAPNIGLFNKAIKVKQSKTGRESYLKCSNGFVYPFEVHMTDLIDNQFFGAVKEDGLYGVYLNECCVKSDIRDKWKYTRVIEHNYYYGSENLTKLLGAVKELENKGAIKLLGNDFSYTSCREYVIDNNKSGILWLKSVRGRIESVEIGELLYDKVFIYLGISSKAIIGYREGAKSDIYTCSSSDIVDSIYIDEKDLTKLNLDLAMKIDLLVIEEQYHEELHRIYSEIQ